MKRNRQMFAIDWLQLFCSNCFKPLPEDGKIISPYTDAVGNHRTYTISVSDKAFIKGFSYNRLVTYNNYPVAVIATSVKDERRRKDGASIKLNNAVLYVTDWYFILNDILDTLGWKPLNITRVDLCCDFNFFLNGLAPQTFLRKYTAKTNASYIREGSNKFCLYGNKDMRAITYDSIRWGSRQSGVSVYMYNKTKELNEVHDKPWIREAWKKAELSSTKDVWRVEISITSQGCGLVSLYNQYFHTLFIDDIKDKNAAMNMFKIYAMKYFSFKKISSNIKYKKDLKPIQLLDVESEQEFKPSHLTENHDTGRMEKIVSNKMAKVIDFLHNTDVESKYIDIELLTKAKNIFDKFHHIKDKGRKAELSELSFVENHVLEEWGVYEKLANLRVYNNMRQKEEQWRQFASSIAQSLIKLKTKKYETMIKDSKDTILSYTFEPTKEKGIL